MSQTLDKTLYQNIPVDLLQPGQSQPRKHFEVTSLQSLADTIKEEGVIQALVVRPFKQQTGQLVSNKYEIIAGERRWRAAQLANLEAVPCLIKNYNDEQAARIALIENMHREGLNPIEEARAISNIIDATLYTHEEAALCLGITRMHVTNLLRLLKLDERVQEMLIKKELTTEHGKILAALSQNSQYFYAIKCVKDHWSKRSLEKAIKGGNKTLPAKDINIVRLEQKLSDHLGSPVMLSEKGCIKIKYANLDIFEGLLKKMGYEEAF